MAKGKKTGGRDFVPGKSGNPKGLPPIPADVKEARKLNQIEFERIVNKFLYMTREEVSKYAQAPGTPTLELLIASILSKAVTQGDQSRLNFVLDRLIGKVADRVAGHDGGPLPALSQVTLITLPRNGREAKN